MRRRTRIISLGLALCAVVGVAIFSNFLARPQPGVAETITHSTDKPDEVKPDNGYVWRGAGDDPKKIVVSSLGIDGYIQNVGVDQNQEIAVPSNIHKAGWFVNSVRPGEKGLSIIDGHLNGRSSDGIFSNLAQIGQGATYEIEFGDGSRKTFRVVSVQTVDLADAPSVLFSQNPEITSQLTLVTCGGRYDSNERLYDKRVIVISELV